MKSCFIHVEQKWKKECEQLPAAMGTWHYTWVLSSPLINLPHFDDFLDFRLPLKLAMDTAETHSDPFWYYLHVLIKYTQKCTSEYVTL